eukprot:6186113-Pleurochrysis_carterae.AAC.2
MRGRVGGRGFACASRSRGTCTGSWRRSDGGSKLRVISGITSAGPGQRQFWGGVGALAIELETREGRSVLRATGEPLARQPFRQCPTVASASPYTSYIF